MLQPLVIPQKNTQTLYIKSDDYTFQTGDTLYFTVKAKPDNDQTDADALISKSWTVGTDAEYDSDGYLIGTVFDPNYHQVIQEVVDADKPAGTILAEVQTGYMINDRILREAMVIVSK